LATENKISQKEEGKKQLSDYSTDSEKGDSLDLNSDISHIINPPDPKCPHFPLLHHPIAARTTTATTAEVKKTRHMS